MFFVHRKDEKEYALKQIEGTGISMSACREIAVSGHKQKKISSYTCYAMDNICLTLWATQPKA